MAKVDLQILQTRYTVTCAEGQEQRMLRAAQLLEDGARKLLDSGKAHRPKDAMAAAALQIIFELLEHDATHRDQEAERVRAGEIIGHALLRLEQALGQQETPTAAPS